MQHIEYGAMEEADDKSLSRNLFLLDKLSIEDALNAAICVDFLFARHRDHQEESPSN